jgi:hypothetical protein
MASGLASFDDLVSQLMTDPQVVGIILTGSRARAGMGTDRSDHDVLLVVVDGAEDHLADESRRDAVLDIRVMAWTTFVDYARPGSAEEWDRYSFAHCQVLKDTAEGQIAAIAWEKATLSVAEAAGLPPLLLDGFLNAVYRSVKNDRDGDTLAARLDAAESIGGYLTYVFALHRRVRPYNKYLLWELTHHPLDRPEWSADRLLPSLAAVLSVDAVAAVRRLVIDLEPVARTAGHSNVLDSWGDDLSLMRGSSAR